MRGAPYVASREIGIDAGHRVVDHGSKCRNLHGHRYTIHAFLAGPLADVGEQTGMVADFGFTKSAMMEMIDRPCDHGMILSRHDPVLPSLVGRQRAEEAALALEADTEAIICGPFGKVCVVRFTPTAENLARHWFERLQPRIAVLAEGRASLIGIRVDETPNCWAGYGPFFDRAASFAVLPLGEG